MSGFILLCIEQVLLLLLIIAVYLLQNSSLLSPIIAKKDGAGSTGSRSLKVLALIGAGVSGFFSFSTVAVADEAEHGLACPSYPWPHKGILSSYDHASYVWLQFSLYFVIFCAAIMFTEDTQSYPS